MILPEEYIFTDEGISGRKSNRPAFQKMIGTAKLKPKPFDVILLWKFSRFARNREDSIVYKSMLRKQCGIDVISISEQLGEDKTSILIEALIEAMDEYYSLNLAEEVKRGMNEKFARGGVVSQPPWGYTVKDGVFTADENAEIVKMIFNDYLSGMGTRSIAMKLNKMGCRSAKGNLFENRTVEYILTNPAYTGKMRRSKNGRDNRDRFHQDKENTIIVEGHHEPIIDDDTFDKVQKVIEGNKKVYGKYYARKDMPVEFMLKGLCHCDTCGSTMVYQSAQKSLQCHRYSKGVCSVSHSIQLNKLNNIVIEKLKSDLISGDFEININIRNQQSPISEKSSIETAIERERKKLIRVQEAYEAGIDTIEEYKLNKSRIQSKIEQLKQQIPVQHEKTPEEIKNDVAERIKSGLKIIENPDASETLKNQTLRNIVDTIIYIKNRQIVEIHYKS